MPSQTRSAVTVLALATLFASGLATAGGCAGSPEPTTMTADHVHHGIDYIEFAVTDMAASKRFYAAAFDWQFTDYGPDYCGIQREGGEAGGFRLEPQVATGGPLVVLYSNDLEGTFERVQAAQARITRPPFDFPGGRRFQFLDPSGNELAVWGTK